MTAAAAWLRRAGTGVLPDGGRVAWSVADGQRGRRWRWTLTDGDVVRHSGLLELDGSGRFSRLELSGRAGLLTLHPEPDDRAIHGNVVTAEGVRPLTFDWSGRAGVEIARDAFGTALLPAGDATGSLVIRPSLGVVAGSGSARLPVDERGVPRLREPREWALEA